MAAWLEAQAAIERLARAQLFLVGGPPRSGTTWLQRLLDAHPEISCGGEGLFTRHLAEPIDSMVAAWRTGIEQKNTRVFRELGGYPLPDAGDADALLGTAILHALERQRAGKPCLAIGEKTPENVFLFDRFRRIFPKARFIGITRDPRDVLASAWHFFHPGEADPGGEQRLDFIRGAIPSLNAGARVMLALAEERPRMALTVTYENMRADPAAVAADLFRFLGVADTPAVVGACVERTSFTAMTGGRAPGEVLEGSFMRTGSSGSWREAFTAEMTAALMTGIGWMFPHFGWTP